MTDDPKTPFSSDPGMCGIPPVETGEWDPYQKVACEPHDKEFNLLKAGLPNKGVVETTEDFELAVAKTAAKGLYAAIMAPIYAIVGGLGGMLRWGQIRIWGAGKNETDNSGE